MPRARPGFNSPKTYVTVIPDREEAENGKGAPENSPAAPVVIIPTVRSAFSVEMQPPDSVRLDSAQFGSGSLTGSSVTKTFGTVADRIIVPTAQ